MTLTLQQKLQAITRNLWWTWRPEIRSIFRDIDIDLYHRLHQNPWPSPGRSTPPTWSTAPPRWTCRPASTGPCAS
jgi:hypothetical protein